MIRRAVLVLAIFVAIVGGFSGVHAARKSCDVTQITVGKIVISTKPVCLLPCIMGQPMCGETSSQSSESLSTGTTSGASR